MDQVAEEVTWYNRLLPPTAVCYQVLVVGARTSLVKVVQADHFLWNIRCLGAVIHGVVFEIREHFRVARAVFLLQTSDHLFGVVTVKERRLARQLRITTKQRVSDDIAGNSSDKHNLGLARFSNHDNSIPKENCESAAHMFGPQAVSGGKTRPWQLLPLHSTSSPFPRARCSVPRIEPLRRQLVRLKLAAMLRGPGNVVGHLSGPAQAA